MATKYKVLNAVVHNEKRYEVGSTVELEDEHAGPLLEVGAVEKAPAKGKAADADKPAE